MPLFQRKSPRLQDYDYSQSGAYFVTICTYNKNCYFGGITDTTMQLSNIGQIANERWAMLSEFYQSVQLDDYVVMPNHLHGILFLLETGEKSPELGNIIGGYKSGVSRTVRQETHLKSSLWQSRFHDHIIRNEVDLNRIREYIQTNPARWKSDTFYEARSGRGWLTEGQGKPLSLQY